MILDSLFQSHLYGFTVVIPVVDLVNEVLPALFIVADINSTS